MWGCEGTAAAPRPWFWSLIFASLARSSTFASRCQLRVPPDGVTGERVPHGDGAVLLPAGRHREAM